MPHNDKARHVVRFFVTSWQCLVRFAAHADTDDRVAKQWHAQAGTISAYNESEAGARCDGIDMRITMTTIYNKHGELVAMLNTPAEERAARAAIFAATVRGAKKDGATPAVRADYYATRAERIASRALTGMMEGEAHRAARDASTAVRRHGFLPKRWKNAEKAVAAARAEAIVVAQLARKARAYGGTPRAALPGYVGRCRMLAEYARLAQIAAA